MGKIKNYRQYDLVEEQYEHFAKEIQQAIDNEIMESMLDETLVKQDGWTKVNILNFPFTPDIVETTSAWMHMHATGDYRYLAGHWYVENAQDATAFILKFS